MLYFDPKAPLAFFQALMGQSTAKELGSIILFLVRDLTPEKEEEKNILITALNAVVFADFTNEQRTKPELKIYAERILENVLVAGNVNERALATKLLAAREVPCIPNKEDYDILIEAGMAVLQPNQGQFVVVPTTPKRVSPQPSATSLYYVLSAIECFECSSWCNKSWCRYNKRTG